MDNDSKRSMRSEVVEPQTTNNRRRRTRRRVPKARGYAYDKIEYVSVRTYLSENRIRTIRILDPWFVLCISNSKIVEVESYRRRSDLCTKHIFPSFLCVFCLSPLPLRSPTPTGRIQGLTY